MYLASEFYKSVISVNIEVNCARDFMVSERERGAWTRDLGSSTDHTDHVSRSGSLCARSITFLNTRTLVNAS